MQNFSTAVAIGTPKANGTAPQIFSLANTTTTSFDYWVETAGTALRYFVIGRQQLWGGSAAPSGYAAIAVLPTAFDTINYVAVGIGSLTADDSAYTKIVSMLKELSTTTQIVFRTSLETSPTVYYLAVGV